MTTKKQQKQKNVQPKRNENTRIVINTMREMEQVEFGLRIS